MGEEFWKVSGRVQKWKLHYNLVDITLEESKVILQLSVGSQKASSGRESSQVLKEAQELTENRHKG